MTSENLRYEHSLRNDVMNLISNLYIMLIRLFRRRPGQKLGPTSVLQGLIEDNEEKGKPPHVILIGQLFSFIGSEPQKAVSTL